MDDRRSSMQSNRKARKEANSPYARASPARAQTATPVSLDSEAPDIGYADSFTYASHVLEPCCHISLHFDYAQNLRRSQ